MAGDVTTVARPYAEAVFARAKDAGQLDAWSETLTLLGSIVGNEEIALRIGNPNVPRERMRDIILDIAGADLLPQAQNLVKLLAENDRLAVLPEIGRLFEDLRAKEQGVRQVLVRSAYVLSAAEEKKLAEALKARLGTDVELTVEKDPGLIGGVEVRSGDLVIDGTVRGRLQRLANALQT
jgi:F-type H+-transporting ATPase subunit delta